MKDTAKNTISALKTSSIRVKLVVGAAVAVFAVSTVCNLLDVKFAYRVTYNDDTVGFVSSASELEDVKKDVLSEIRTSNAGAYIGKTGVTLSVAFGNDIESSSALAEKILSGNEQLVHAAVLTVNGQPVCAVKDKSEVALSAVLNARKAAFCNGSEDESYFVKDVKVEMGYYPVEKIVTAAAAEAVVSELEVVTVATKTYSEAISFKTEQTKSDKYLKGYKKVDVKGVKGEKSVTATITYVNGAETERVILNETVVCEPVTQKETVGTAVVNKTQGTVSSSKNAIFIWPAKKVSGQKITSYWGDGRNHKGLDIACKKGTPIYAAMGGTVTLSKYKSDYGYHVIIDHGNGYSTLYAHASELCVKVGDVVETGDTIALVGSTGQSTGPHVHFEVRINGTRVNPINYIQR